tara:strand:+ start:877 stop:1656 length:780 start_codon:yes stop_codon:yes gene_type:complete
VEVQKLFLFDFDGVIVDGMNEYWNSSLLACDKFLNSSNIAIDEDLYNEVSDTFREIRPWVKYGWEMIIIVHEIIKIENPLNSKNKKEFINKYHQNCQEIIQDNSWLAEDLQKFLDESREYQINKDFEMWVNLHKPFYEVMDFIEKLKKDQIKTGIITTKGKIFAAKLLHKLKIFPEFVFGYESGTKIEIAKELSKKYEIVGFLEDRRNTLIDIKENPETKEIPCFLAEWGYLKNSDKNSLPKEIRLLKLKNLKDLLAIL